MPILHSYYQDVYRCPIVRLDGYSAQHGLSTGILAYLDFGGATGSSKDGLAETMLAFATERGTLRGIAVQPHDGAAVDVLIIAVQDGHGGAPHFP